MVQLDRPAVPECAAAAKRVGKPAPAGGGLTRRRATCDRRDAHWLPALEVEDLIAQEGGVLSLIVTYEVEDKIKELFPGVSPVPGLKYGRDRS